MMIYRYANDKYSIEHIISEGYDNDKFEMHVHHQAELLLLLKGKSVFHVEGTKYNIKEGDVIVTRPNEMHFNEPDSLDSYERIIISFNTDIFKSIDSEDKLTNFLYNRREGQYNLYTNALENPTIKKEIINISGTVLDENLYGMSTLMRILLALNNLFEIENSKSEPHTTIEKIVKYINNNLDKDLTLQNIASIFYISRSQLFRTFKSEIGMNIGDYIIAKRMASAHEKLKHGAKASQIYTECGFTDYSSFFRSYKKYYGISPKQTEKYT